MHPHASSAALSNEAEQGRVPRLQMQGRAQRFGPDAQLNGVEPVLRVLRQYAAATKMICNCKRALNQAAQRCAYAGAAMSGLHCKRWWLRQILRDWEIARRQDELCNYVNLGRQFGGSRSAWKARAAERRSKSKPTVVRDTASGNRPGKLRGSAKLWRLSVNGVRVTRLYKGMHTAVFCCVSKCKVHSFKKQPRDPSCMCDKQACKRTMRQIRSSTVK